MALSGLKYYRVWQKVGDWEGGSWTVSREAWSVAMSKSLCEIPSEPTGVLGTLPSKT